MTDDAESHQLRIRKLQEMLAGISSGIRKDSSTGMQSRRPENIENLHSTMSSIRTEQKPSQTEKKPSVEQIPQQVRVQTEEKKEARAEFEVPQEKPRQAEKELSVQQILQQLKTTNRRQAGRNKNFYARNVTAGQTADQ